MKRNKMKCHEITWMNVWMNECMNEWMNERMKWNETKWNVMTCKDMEWNGMISGGGGCIVQSFCVTE